MSFADGSAKVRINSDGLTRDRKIYDTIALKKSLSIPELNLSFSVDLVEPRIFYTSGYCLSVVSGTLEHAGSTNQFGVLLNIGNNQKLMGVCCDE